MGTGLGLLMRGRKTESRDMEVGPRDLRMEDGSMSASPRLPGGIGPSNTPTPTLAPMRPNNQVTSISEVLFPEGGSDKMS